MKKLMTMIVVITVSLTGLFLTGCGRQADFTVGILANSHIPAFELATPGFQNRLTELLDAEGKTVRFIYNNASGDMAVATTVANNFAAQNVDLIFTLGTGASQATRPVAEIAGIPQVFGAITDPVGAGLIGDNLTGSSSALPMNTQVDLMEELLGEELSASRQVAFLYTTAEDNSRRQGDLLIEAGQEMGVEVVRFGLNSIGDLQTVLTLIAADSTIQAIYIGTDNTIADNMQQVSTLNALSQRPLPIVVADFSMAERGGIAAFALDYSYFGRVSAELAFEVLMGTPAGEVPIYFANAESLSLLINQTLADELGITIPEELLRRANRII